MEKKEFCKKRLKKAFIWTISIFFAMAGNHRFCETACTETNRFPSGENRFPAGFLIECAGDHDEQR